MEGLGAASGVIAVAQVTIQLGQTIQTLIGFWKAVRDAPEDVNMLFEEIDMLSSLIGQARQKEPYEESDPIIDTASCRCNALLSKLEAKLPASASDFETPSFRMRTWKRLKHALKKNEIKELMSTIERMKTTLTFAHIRNMGRTQRLLEMYTRDQQVPFSDASGSVQSYPSRFNQVDFRLAASGQDNTTPSRAKALTHETLPRHNSQDRSSIEQYDNFDDSAPLIEHAITRTYSSLGRWGVLIRTPLYSISYQTRTHKVTTTTVSGSKVSMTTTHLWTVYPSRLIALFGSSCGLWAASSCSTPGRWSLSPFNAVPETSLIFDFCRKGYLPGIKALLQRGDASVRDMDPTGRTPFNVTTEFSQVEAAKLLIEEGADPYLGSSDVPLLALETLAPEDSQAGLERGLSTISLLQLHCPDTFNGQRVNYMLGRLLLFCRPGKDVPLTQAFRRDTALKAVVQLCQEFPPIGSPNLTALASFMIEFGYAHGPLRWVLRRIKGELGWDGCNCCNCTSACPRSSLIEALKRKLPYRDPVSTRLIMQKTKDLHRTFNSFVYLGPGVPLATATSLAMSQPSLFFPFRNNLLQLGYELDEFIALELAAQDSPLANEGWNQETLTILFESNRFPNTHNGILLTGYFGCGRCGRSERSGPIMVDLPWRRHLRSIRTRKGHDSCCGKFACTGLQWPSYEVMAACLLKNDDYGVEDPKLLAVGKALNETSLSNVPGRLSNSGILEPWPYLFVCPDSCADGVCVSGAYENGFTDEPDLPPYNGTTSESHVGPMLVEDPVDDVGYEMGHPEDEACPTKNMPGAYIE